MGSGCTDIGMSDDWGQTVYMSSEWFACELQRKVFKA